MSAHVKSFPFAAPNNRDLSDFELWERSLRRSMHRREITEAARKHAARRKGAALAVTASMAAGPAAAPFAALASTGGGRSVATGSASPRSAIELPSGSLVSFGDTGAAVAAVQRQVGVDDDGIFGPITRGAVGFVPEALRAARDGRGRHAHVDGAVQVQRLDRGRRRQDRHDRLQRRRRDRCARCRDRRRSRVDRRGHAAPRARDDPRLRARRDDAPHRGDAEARHDDPSSGDLADLHGPGEEQRRDDEDRSPPRRPLRPRRAGLRRRRLRLGPDQRARQRT